jgi:serine/threonine-protein kinase
MISKGGFSVIYDVYSIQYKMHFAAKVIQRNKAKNIIFAQKEAKALSTLIHTNIINLYNFFENEQFSILILELCENGTLEQLLEKGPMKVPEFIHIARSIVDALCLCHENQIAHCDIKPSNIIFDGNHTTKLCDFGLCQIRNPEVDFLYVQWLTPRLNFFNQSKISTG